MLSRVGKWFIATSLSKRMRRKVPPPPTKGPVREKMATVGRTVKEYKTKTSAT